MAHPIKEDYYEVLGLRNTARITQIKTKYRQLARIRHPDKNPENPNATEESQLLEAAYSTLVDPDRRHDYDFNHYPTARQATDHASYSGWTAWSWVMGDTPGGREPRPYSGPAGSCPVYRAAPSHPGPSSTTDIPTPTPTLSIPSAPPTPPRPATPNPATFAAERTALERQLGDLRVQRARLTSEARAARTDLVVVECALEQMRTPTSDASRRRSSLIGAFSARKRTEEAARVQEGVIQRNLALRAKEGEREVILQSLEELNARLMGVEQEVGRVKKEWEGTWNREEVKGEAVAAWEKERERRREVKVAGEEMKKAAERKREFETWLDEGKKGAREAARRMEELERGHREFTPMRWPQEGVLSTEGFAEEFVRGRREEREERIRAEIRAGKQKATDKTATANTATDNQAGPATTSHPLPLAPDEQASLARRQRMMLDEIEEMDRAFATMLQQEEEQLAAKTSAAQEATAFANPLLAHSLPPAWNVSVPPLTRPDGTICHHKGIWAPDKGRYTCVWCLGLGSVTRIFRCQACGRDSNFKCQLWNTQNTGLAPRSPSSSK